MRKEICIAILFAMAAALWAETVQKNSAPFSFPTIVGITVNQSAASARVVFAGTPHCAGKSTIFFSWSIPTSAKKGTISLYSLSGALVGTVSIASPQGKAGIDFSTNKLARGIYFAKLSFGAVEKTINFISYR